LPLDSLFVARARGDDLEGPAGGGRARGAMAARRPANRSGHPAGIIAGPGRVPLTVLPASLNPLPMTIAGPAPPSSMNRRATPGVLFSSTISRLRLRVIVSQFVRVRRYRGECLRGMLHHFSTTARLHRTRGRVAHRAPVALYKSTGYSSIAGTVIATDGPTWPRSHSPSNKTMSLPIRRLRVYLSDWPVIVPWRTMAVSETARKAAVFSSVEAITQPGDARGGTANSTS
jgi:hypothetical protein